MLSLGYFIPVDSPVWWQSGRDCQFEYKGSLANKPIANIWGNPLAPELRN